MPLSRRRPGDMEAMFLRSHLLLDGPLGTFENAYAWYLDQLALDGFTTWPAGLGQLEGWRFEGQPLRLAHESGRFFSLEGIRVETSHGPMKSWDQPIVNQPEIGILGFLTKRFEGVPHLLVQAKREPGNVNCLQLAPTVQATWSNYTRVHKGRNIPYLEYFTSNAKARVLLDQLHNEQASRFLGKCNRNMIVETNEDVTVREGFRWMTLGQLKALLHLPNIVNMDTRSVLSLIPLANLDAGGAAEGHGADPDLDENGEKWLLSSTQACRALSTMDEIVAWLYNLRARSSLDVTRIPLDAMRYWSMGPEGIRHESGMHFSIIGLRVEACCRETRCWSQPILHHSGRGLRGFLAREINGVLHLLSRACIGPGSIHGMEIGPSVSCSDALARRGTKLAPGLLDLFLEPDPAAILYRCVQSEEGGRFHHFENEYVILRAPAGLPHPGPNYRWLTLGQLLRLSRHGQLNIEARNLLACICVLPGALSAVHAAATGTSATVAPAFPALAANAVASGQAAGRDTVPEVLVS